MLEENPTFIVRGEDGEEYGPVDLAELRDWVQENRAGLGTQVKRDEPHAIWEPWQNFPELVALLAEIHATGDVAGLVIAPMWRRVLAFAIDLFLVNLLGTPIVFVLQAYTGIPNIEWSYLMAAIYPDAPAPPNIFFYGDLCNVISVLIFVFYFAGFTAAHGRTPAKSIFRIRVVTADGQKPYFVKSLARAVLLALSVNILFFLPLVMAFFNPQRRTLHDVIAGTYVVEA